MDSVRGVKVFAKELVDSFLNETEQGWILATEEDVDLAASARVRNLIALAHKRPNFEVRVEEQQHFEEWFEGHSILEPRRALVVQTMQEQQPTAEAVRLGVANFPAWWDAWWVQVVFHRWSVRLAEAVDAAEQALGV